MIKTIFSSGCLSRLQSLKIAADDHNYLWLDMLIAPNLNRLRLWLPDEAAQHSLPQSIPSRCPDLQELIFEYPSRSKMLRSQIQSSLLLWTSLSSLDAGELDASTLQYVASMTQLSKLTLQIPEDGTCSPALLPYVTDLTFTIDNLSHFHLSIHNVRVPNLRRLEIAPGPYSLGNWGYFYSAIKDAYSGSPLAVLLFDDTHLGASPVTPDQVRPLYALSSLTTVALSNILFPGWTDDDLQELGHSWPQLRTLILSIRNTVSRSTTITLLGLAHLTRLCKWLTEVEISLDAIAIPPLDDRWKTPNTNLTYIKFNRSPIQDPVEVTHFLSRIAPCLRQIRFELSHGYSASNWACVADMLVELTTARP